MKILFDINTAGENIDVGKVFLKQFQLYKLTFYGVGHKIKPTIEKIKTDYGEKLVLLWSTTEKLGLQTNLFIMPITNPIPIVAVLAGSAILAGLGLTLLILHKTEHIINIAIPLFVLPAMFLFRKEISRYLKKIK